MSELARKLGIKSGFFVCLLGGNAGEASLIKESCPEGVILSDAITPKFSDMIFFWPMLKSEIIPDFTRLQNLIHPDGAIWAVIPKKKYASKAGIDFTWDELQAAALQTDLVDNKIASISERSYATRFVIRKDRRSKYG